MNEELKEKKAEMFVNSEMTKKNGWKIHVETPSNNSKPYIYDVIETHD